MAVFIASLEDDPEQARLIHSIITRSGHRCLSYATGADFLQALSTHRFDLILLDRELPDADGVELLAHIRSTVDRVLPVLFVTSHSMEDDIVSGLSAGADDYVVKPVRAAELAARVEAHLRRASIERPERTALAISKYAVDLKRRTIRLGEEPIELTAKEYDIAFLLFRNIGCVVSREHMIQTIWGRELGALSRTVDTHVSRVRHKLQLYPKNGVQLTSIYAHGYRLDLHLPP